VPYDSINGDAENLGILGNLGRPGSLPLHNL
jgi:hypothetical protein